MGNGSEESGDGWKFRGVGLIQTTGKNNIEALSKKLGMSLDDAIRFAETPEGAVKAACIFWVDNNLNRFADKDDVLGLTKAINGGTNGLDDRKELTERAKAALS
jgi:putative chitinase